MTTTAQSIIKEVQTQLQDLTGTRWSAVDLVAYLNDGQRDIATLRPDMFMVTADVALAGGARQTVPVACVKFVELNRNTGGRSVRQVERATLDAVEPSWYAKRPVSSIIHFCYDARDNTTYWVYPPAIAGTRVELIYSTLPADVPAPTGPVFTAVNGDVGVSDIFKNALIHFCLFRAFSVDAEFGGNAQMSGAHYQLFKTCLSDEVTTRQAVQPTV